MTVLRSDGAPAGPLCRATDACKSSPRAKHCKSCASKARWEDPARLAAMREKMREVIAAKPRPPFKDERRVRSAVLYASAFGLTKASKMLGIRREKISLWRRRIEEIDGVTVGRLAPAPPKLSIEKAREIRQQLAAGEKQEYLAAIYGVSTSTIYRIAQGVLYPEIKREEDIAAWRQVGSRRAA